MKFLFWSILGLSSSLMFAQQQRNMSSLEVYHSLEKLNFLGSALYIAAHPDDENTRLISYLSHQTHARTAYLSLTRGDGGQNLIGTELREFLGVIRTEELLAARRLDGGEQFFTRANDFGYSKHPDETLRIWNKDTLLKDMVRIIRQFQPDVIINRFNHRTPGTTHGHHTTSAMLSYEAFDLVSDPGVYPGIGEVWTPSRLFFNTSPWFYSSEEAFLKDTEGKMIKFDIGTYYPASGQSNSEISAMASSQHLSQGFGRLNSRGSQAEYVEFIKGEIPKESDIFAGIDTSWNRVKGGKAIGLILDAILADFNFRDPSVHLPQLLEALKTMHQLEDSHWKNLKLPELQEIILACTGGYLEASAQRNHAIPGEEIDLQLEAVIRNNSAVTLDQIRVTGSEQGMKVSQNLQPNKDYTFNLKTRISPDASPSTPYWLFGPTDQGLYEAPDDLIGLAESPEPVKVEFLLKIQDVPVRITRDLVHRFAKPDQGERYEPFEILPPATLSFTDKVAYFPDGAPRRIGVMVKGNGKGVKGTLQLDLPEGWKAVPQSLPFETRDHDQGKTYYFEVTPPKGENDAFLEARLMVNNRSYPWERTTIAYGHIPKQEVLTRARLRLMRTDIQKAGEFIGYIAGAGDEIPESLRRIGYRVQPVDPMTMTAEFLQQFDAIVVGIRAYNVNDNLKLKQPELLKYVERGGTLLVQYNTAGRRGSGELDVMPPYPLSLSADRVTDENSTVSFLDPGHPVMNFPNKITSKDFNGWVQERGLYFPDRWDAAYTPLLSMSDPGDSEMKGSLLVAPYGKGYYIYTGLSFFRELPAGVPGAYKLFANMLSLGSQNEQTTNRIKG